MRLATVLFEDRRLFGAVTTQGFVDFTAAFAGRCLDLREWIEGEHWSEAASVLEHATNAIALEYLTFLPPIPNDDARMFAVGWSYRDHQVETGAAVPSRPSIFLKLPSSLVGHGQALVRAKASNRFDFEGEIAVIIGKAGRNIAPTDAMAHIAGYSIVMDGSMRDWQQDSVTAGKNFDNSSAYGPWIVTVDEITDPNAMELVTRLNGNEMQRAYFSNMIWGVPALVAYVSSICRLKVGDAISTGTPSGVGNKRKPPVFLQINDTIAIEVTGLGTLINRVVDEDETPC